MTSTGAEVAGTEVVTVGTKVEVLRMGNEDVFVIADEYAKQDGASQQVVDQGYLEDGGDM